MLCTSCHCFVSASYSHVRVRQRETFPFFPSGFFGWSNNSVDIRQINRRKTNLICTVGAYRNTSLKEVTKGSSMCS